MNDKDKEVVDFIASECCSEFIEEKKRLPKGKEIAALAIGFQTGIKFMNQLIEATVPEDEEN
jgi:hypothetical protein